jgi:hypothetical protein
MKTIHLKRNLLVISILLGMSSCNTLRLNNSSKPIAEDNLRYKTSFIQIDSNNVANYECDNFASNALTNYSIASIRQEYKFLKCTQEPIANIHYPSIIDTVYIFSNNKNTIHIYRAQHKDFTYFFDVTNPKFKLTGDIKPGMSKEAFSQKFQISQSIDKKVQIINSEGNTKYMFYFNRHILKRITVNLYLD